MAEMSEHTTPTIRIGRRMRTWVLKLLLVIFIIQLGVRWHLPFGALLNISLWRTGHCAGFHWAFLDWRTNVTEKVGEKMRSECGGSNYSLSQRVVGSDYVARLRAIENACP